jgi:nitrilase
MSWPRFVAAAVQAAPVYLEREATIDKACGLIREAGRAGARLVAFPEVFVAGFPHWIYLDRPQANERHFVTLLREAVDVPGPATDKLGRAAREAGAYVVIGVNERSRRSFGELFNTNVILGPDGALVGVHRKLMPTYAEKMVWSFGDGSTLRVHDTAIGRLGTLCCGENTNPLARFALIAQAEQVHVANYPARPAVDAYDLRRAIEIRSAAHAFEGKCFVVVAGSVISRGMREFLGDTPEKRRLLGEASTTFTGILGPDGQVVAGPAAGDAEEIVYGEVELERIVAPKLFHDVAGNYNRFDVLSLLLDTTPRAAIHDMTRPIGGPEWGMPRSRHLVQALRAGVASASPEELRKLVEALLASLPDA